MEWKMLKVCSLAANGKWPGPMNIKSKEAKPKMGLNA